MRLSEAIRIGAMLKPQGFKQNAFDESCALRAAADACGMPNDGSVPYADLGFKFPELLRPVACPVGGCYRGELRGELVELMHAIWHANDDLKWTREQIATWVELHEPIPLPERETLAPELEWMFTEGK